MGRYESAWTYDNSNKVVARELFTVARELFTIPTLEEVLGKISGAKVFSILDAKHGFWQVPLHRESHNTDDILVTGQTQQEHDDRLRLVLDKLSNASLRLNKQKCKISQDQVDFLGHRLGKDGLHPNPAKITALMQMVPPQ